jgi:hypothetical protein
LDLSEVLPDGDELDAEAAGGGGDLGEIGEGSDACGFVGGGLAVAASGVKVHLARSQCRRLDLAIGGASLLIGS